MNTRPAMWLLAPDLGYLAPFIPKAGPVQQTEPMRCHRRDCARRHPIAAHGQRVTCPDCVASLRPESPLSKLWSASGLLFVVAVVIFAIGYMLLERFVW